MSNGTAFVRKALAAIDASADYKAKLLHWELIELQAREQRRKLKEGRA